MNIVRAVLLVLLTVGGTVAAATLAAAVGPAAGSASVETDQSQSNESAVNQSNGTLGSKVSSFMQTSASQTQGAVDTEMWVASFNNSTNQSEQKNLVHQQTSEIEQKLEQLIAEKKQLVEKKKAGNISQAEFQAKMSQVVGKYISLTEAINKTEPLAESAGVENSSLDYLRQDARNLTGPEVAAVAQSLNNSNAPGLQQNGNDNRPTDVPANNQSAQGDQPGLVDDPETPIDESRSLPEAAANQTNNRSELTNRTQVTGTQTNESVRNGIESASNESVVDADNLTSNPAYLDTRTQAE